MSKLKREAEMKQIVKKIQRLNDRLKELNYTMTDSASTITIFDDLDREEYPEGRVVDYIL